MDRTMRAAAVAFGVAAALVGARPALADEALMARPIQAGALHEGTLDMVAYWRPVGGASEVTATFAPKAGGAPMRVVMALAPGDAVAFAMPGHRGTLYRFARTAEGVAASAQAVPAVAAGL